MRLRVRITPKEGVLDPEGNAIARALLELGHDKVAEVLTGKIVELELATDDPEEALRLTREMCDKLLANPVIEQYSVDLL